MGDFTDILSAHQPLVQRRKRSDQRIRSVRDRLEGRAVFSGGQVTVFAAGSLARGEAGTTSDLDVFLTTENDRLAQNRLFTFQVIAELIRVNQDEGFPEFSNDGQYLRVYSVSDLVSHTGSPVDDQGNYFTARMLMLLEGQPLLHETEFRRQQHHLISNYFRDGKGREDFKPLFLLNDILRYWRTLCLNYEQTRDDSARPWRKKNVNLKFSRMMTVFGTVLPLIRLETGSLAPDSPVWEMRPLDRLAFGLDSLGDTALLDEWKDVLDGYEEFLAWKETEDMEHHLGDLKERVRARAAELSSFLHCALSHPSIPLELRRFLIL